MNKAQRISEDIPELEAKANLYRHLAGFFATLSDPTRLRILQFLSEGGENNERLLEQKVREGLYEFLGTLCKVLADSTRIKILDLLYSRGQCPAIMFSKIVSHTQKESSTIGYHLRKLVEYGLVKKVGRGSYQITEIGVSIWAEISIADIMAITEKAIGIGKIKELIN